MFCIVNYILNVYCSGWTMVAVGNSDILPWHQILATSKVNLAPFKHEYPNSSTNGAVSGSKSFSSHHY